MLRDKRGTPIPAQSAICTPIALALPVICRQDLRCLNPINFGLQCPPLCVPHPHHVFDAAAKPLWAALPSVLAMVKTGAQGRQSPQPRTRDWSCVQAEWQGAGRAPGWQSQPDVSVRTTFLGADFSFHLRNAQMNISLKTTHFIELINATLMKYLRVHLLGLTEWLAGYTVCLSVWSLPRSLSLSFPSH